MAIVYRHRRLDNNQIFYIGIGTKIKRAFDFNKRSEWWKKIYAKSEVLVEIVAIDIDWEVAKELECFLIVKYGRTDLGKGTLVNMTDGGDGVLGRTISEKHKKALSESALRNIDKIKERFSIANKNKKLSDETKKKISDKNKGLVRTNEVRNKISQSLIGNKFSFGFKHTQETKSKMSNSGLGRKHTTSHKLKNSNAKKKLILNLNNGIFYIGIKEVCDTYNLEYFNLASSLNGKLKNKTNFIYC